MLLDSFFASPLELFELLLILPIYFNNSSREHHFDFEAPVWYWLFVNAVWLFLFLTIYWWRS